MAQTGTVNTTSDMLSTEIRYKKPGATGGMDMETLRDGGRVERVGLRKKQSTIRLKVNPRQYFK